MERERPLIAPYRRSHLVPTTAWPPALQHDIVSLHSMSATAVVP